MGNNCGGGSGNGSGSGTGSGSGNGSGKHANSYFLVPSSSLSGGEPKPLVSGLSGADLKPLWWRVQAPGPAASG